MRTISMACSPHCAPATRSCACRRTLPSWQPLSRIPLMLRQRLSLAPLRYTQHFVQDCVVAICETCCMGDCARSARGACYRCARRLRLPTRSACACCRTTARRRQGTWRLRRSMWRSVQTSIERAAERAREGSLIGRYRTPRRTTAWDRTLASPGASCSCSHHAGGCCFQPVRRGRSSCAFHGRPRGTWRAAACCRTVLHRTSARATQVGSAAQASAVGAHSC
mmetsp:Transcript_12314/g.26600  ORF Transcript_12314/g.26600 Transcript_12314/m.26600 type:complete len:223 (-) Transcript_12314:355-1023(-)